MNTMKSYKKLLIKLLKRSEYMMNNKMLMKVIKARINTNHKKIQEAKRMIAKSNMTMMIMIITMDMNRKNKMNMKKKV